METNDKHPMAQSIVTDQPEIYEYVPSPTEDIGVSDKDSLDEPADSAISLIEVPIKQAFSYFAERENEIAKFYVQRYGEYKISGAKSDEESDIEKYHRLVSEVNELLNKFQAQNAEKLDKSELSAIKSLDHSALTNNLEVLSRQLKALEFAANDGSLNPTQSEFKIIESKLNKLSTEADDEDDKNFLPPSDKTSETAKLVRMSALERRLNMLENILGHSDPKAQTLFKATNCQSLIEAVNTLGSWLTLFHPESSQKIKKELAFLTQRFEAISDKSNQYLDSLEPKAKASLGQLCDLVTSTDNYRAMVPTIIHRLNSMEELQHRASQVAATVSYLEQAQSQILENLQSNKVEIESLNKMFAKNMELIKEYSNDIDVKISRICNEEP